MSDLRFRNIWTCLNNLQTLSVLIHVLLSLCHWESEWIWEVGQWSTYTNQHGALIQISMEHLHKSTWKQWAPLKLCMEPRCIIHNEECIFKYWKSIAMTGVEGVRTKTQQRWGQWEVLLGGGGSIFILLGRVYLGMTLVVECQTVCSRIPLT